MRIQRNENMKRRLIAWGKQRGIYDAKHRLHDYRPDFQRDIQLAWAYIAMPMNINGTEDEVGKQIWAEVSKSNDFPKTLIQSFVDFYIEAFTEYQQKQLTN